MFLFYNVGPPIISTPDKQSSVVNEGATLFLPCAYQANPAPEVSLRFSSSEAPPSLLPLPYSTELNGFVLDPLDISDNGRFYCIVTNEFGSTNISRTVTVYGKYLVILCVFVHVLM